MDDATSRQAMVRTTVNILLTDTGTDFVGINWVYEYIKRTPAIQSCFHVVMIMDAHKKRTHVSVVNGF